MAIMHILTGNGIEYQVVMHFDVPVGSNSVGNSWGDVLINSGWGGTTQLVEGTGLGEITPAEKIAIEAGAVHEHSGSFRVESGGTSNDELQTSLREFYDLEEIRVINNLKRVLKYFGHTEI